MKAGYEYNDEIYYRADSDGGMPLKAFSDKNLANMYEKAMNLKEFRNVVGDNSHMEFSHYFYDLGDIDSTGKLRDVLDDIGVGTKDNWDINIPGDITDEQLLKIIDNVNIRFYEVVEVDDEVPMEIYKAGVAKRENSSRDG